MRVLLVRSESTGGIGTHVSALEAGLKEGGIPADTLRATGILGVRNVRNRVADYDVVHAHGIRAGAVACVALGRRARRAQRLIVTVHNAPLPGGGLRGTARRAVSTLLERVIARRADVVLGASLDLVKRAESLGAREVRFSPVSAALLGPPTRTRTEARAEFGVGPDDPVVILLAVGRLAPQKDYPTLLAASELLQGLCRISGTKRAEALVLIAGDGPLRAGLQARIDAEHLPVRLLGHRTDVPNLLCAADAFVMCSAWEARPLAIQEALRAGVPVVATRVGGIPDLVGTAADLVAPGDPRALADALGTLLWKPLGDQPSNPEPRTRVGGWFDAFDADDELAAVLAVYGDRQPPDGEPGCETRISPGGGPGR